MGTIWGTWVGTTRGEVMQVGAAAGREQLGGVGAAPHSSKLGVTAVLGGPGAIGGPSRAVQPSCGLRGAVGSGLCRPGGRRDPPCSWDWGLGSVWRCAHGLDIVGLDLGRGGTHRERALVVPRKILREDKEAAQNG